jgi:hypothetical protein
MLHNDYENPGRFFPVSAELTRIFSQTGIFMLKSKQFIYCIRFDCMKITRRRARPMFKNAGDRSARQIERGMPNETYDDHRYYRARI